MTSMLYERQSNFIVNQQMSGMYTNKKKHVVIGTFMLQGHGIQKSSFELSRPLPEAPEDPSPCDPFSNLHGSSPENSEAFSESASSTIGCFSNNSWLNNSVGTMTTGRSSVFSWGNDDEFERKAEDQVCNMFYEVENCLYENEEIKRTKELTSECLTWNTSFPYLRLLGKQIVPTNETGTQVVESPSVCVRLEDVQQEANDGKSLSVSGNKVEPKVVPQNQNECFNEDCFSHLEEEVFAIDGIMEEFIAYDYNNEEETISQTPSKHSIPPVTPSMAIHNAVISECFDHVWDKLTHVLEDLLKLFASSRTNKGCHQVVSSYDMERFLESAMNFQMSRDHYEGLPMTQSQIQIRLKTPSGFSNTTSTDFDTLNELITIRSVPLKERSSLALRDYEPTSREVVSRPVSSSVGQYRQFPKSSSSFRNAEHQFYTRMMSAKLQNKRNIRLQPIHGLKTAGHPEHALGLGEVRGTRLQTADRANNSSSMSQYWNNRSGTLPPLSRLGTADTTVPIDRLKSPKRSSRASSAIINDAKQISMMRKRNSFLNLPDSRPNTMNSFRGDAFLSKQHGFKSRESILNTGSKSLLHTHHTTINEDGDFYHYPTVFKSPSYNNTRRDDFVLWGHGPPLISASQRKGKSHR